MTRAEAYAEGFQKGRRWAEEDIQARRGMRDVYLRGCRYQSEVLDADILGKARGYRDTWHRWDAGTLTWEMLEHAPLGRNS